MPRITLFLALTMFVLTMISCTNNQNETSEINLIDSNNDVLFTITEVDNRYSVNSNDVDAYIREDLKLPRSHSLDYVEFFYNKDLNKGTIVIQYIDEELRQIPIGFYFSSKKMGDIEVFGIDGNGGKKYKCQPEWKSKCLACCDIFIDTSTSILDCSCQIFQDVSCAQLPTGCELVEIKNHQGQGN